MSVWLLGPLFASVVQISSGISQITPPPPDSQAILSSLRGAQRRFEWIRRQHLPRVLGSVGGRCDVRVGRFCYWDDDEDPPWRPRPEAEDVTRERSAFLERLDSAAAILPGDAWIAGQRVRYLVETARFQDALWALEECATEAWWCHALRGLVLHSMGNYVAAESSFEQSLATMTEEQRCEWIDLARVLDGKGTGRYRDLSCSDRARQNVRIWWLSDPLFLVPGNERRSEHFSRLVIDRLMDGTAIVYGSRWGRDNRELVVRYGWAVGWEREPQRGLDPTPRIIGHHAHGGMRFLIPYEYVVDTESLEWGEWDIDPSVPQSRAAMGYATEFRALTHHLALFRRGDSAVVVAGYDLAQSPDKDDRVPRPGNAVRAGLFVQQSADDAHGTTLEGGRAAGALGLTTLRRPALVSIEALSRDDSLACRARYWLDITERLPDGFAVSDLLLLTPGPRLPLSLDEAIPRARGSARYEPGEAIELFWEVYNAPADTAHEVTVAVSKVGKGFLRKAVEWMGVASARQPERFRWEGAPGALQEGAGQSLGIRLADEDEGRYLLRLEIRMASGSLAVREREIEVRKQRE